MIEWNDWSYSFFPFVLKFSLPAQAVSVLLHRHRVPSGKYVWPFMGFTMELRFFSICQNMWKHGYTGIFLIRSVEAGFVCYLLKFVSVCSVPGPSGTVGGGGDLTLPMVLMGWMVLALLLFLLRPASLRGRRPTGKPTGPHSVSIHHILILHTSSYQDWRKRNTFN